MPLVIWYNKEYMTSHKKHLIRPLRQTGKISITSKGVGYVSQAGAPEDADDIEIAPQDVNTALHGDDVEFSLLPKQKGKRQSGEITKIIRRAKMRFVGTLTQTDGTLFLEPDDRRMYVDILIANPPASAREGMKALVELLPWSNPKKPPQGTIIEIIGKKGDHDTEMHSIVLEKGFDTRFPPLVEREAEHIDKHEKIASAEEIARRRDFRDTPTCTIDPRDAKDFDDALSVKELPDGTFEIGVHIADVSHYVREGSALDREARNRAFSVYLVDRTIPMLPEVLSNDVCSLNPHVDRLTFSAVFIMHKDGRILDRWFGKTIIHSAKRFTYENAQETLDQGTGVFHKELHILHTLAHKLRKEKFAKGAIDFDQEEIGFELDQNGKPIAIYKKTRLDTHKLVEEFMLLANKEVAEYFYKETTKKGSKEKPFLYRIHDVPNRDKIAELGIFVRALGHDLPLTNGHVTAKDLQALFKQIEGVAEESLIKTAAIRSMAKAVYSTGNIGHFGLAFEYYTHFTSPIRRYPDLLVHRMLHKFLTKAPIRENEFAEYQAVASDSSNKEISAAEAERESKKYKQVEFMQSFVGKEFDGIISGVTEWGIYVEEKNTKAEGMVKLRDLKGDYYVLHEKSYAIVGERTKKKYSLGDKVRFKVVGADIEKKTLDYVLI